MQKNQNKRKLNESELIQQFLDWFSQHANDTSHYVDAYGQSSMTKGEDFIQNIQIFTGIGGSAALIWAHIKGKLKVPGFIKKIVGIGKAVKSSETKEEADEKLTSMGLKPAPMQESKQMKVKKILMILEAQVDKGSKKRK